MASSNANFSLFLTSPKVLRQEEARNSKSPTLRMPLNDFIEPRKEEPY
jgi:hypothetical protein